MTKKQALALIRRRGVVLEAGRGRGPSLADAVAGVAIRGSWWGHAKGQQIFVLSRAVRDDRNILVCRLVSGKITFVHRRLWPALVAAAPRLPKRSLASIRDEHTSTGAHRQITIPFPTWVPAAARRASRALTPTAALALLGHS